jgi:hypothetical protein
VLQTACDDTQVESAPRIRIHSIDTGLSGRSPTNGTDAHDRRSVAGPDRRLGARREIHRNPTQIETAAFDLPDRPILFEDPQASTFFNLFYTGITRLAKNIMQEVVEAVNSMEPAYLFTVRGLKALSREAREAISLRNLPRLAEVLELPWRSNQHIHPSATNKEIV